MMIDISSYCERDCSLEASAHRKRACLVSDPAMSVEHTSPAKSQRQLDVMDPSFELVRHFLNHLADGDQLNALHKRQASPPLVNWEVIQAAIAGCHSVEQAIGRAAVVAAHMSRGGSYDPNPGETLLSIQPETHPFFAASVADIVVDFGDRSRYRTQVARRLAGVFGSAERS